MIGNKPWVPFFEKKGLFLALSMLGALGGYIVSESLPKKWLASLELYANSELYTSLILSDEVIELGSSETGQQYLSNLEEEISPDLILQELAFELQKPSNVFEAIRGSANLSAAEKAILQRQYEASEVFQVTLIPGLTGVGQGRIKIESLSEVERPMSLIEDFLALGVERVESNFFNRINNEGLKMVGVNSGSLKLLNAAVVHQKFDFKLSNDASSRLSAEYSYATLMSKEHLFQVIEITQKQIKRTQDLTTKIAHNLGSHPFVLNYRPPLAPVEPVFPNTFLLILLGLLIGLCVALAIVSYSLVKK